MAVRSGAGLALTMALAVVCAPALAGPPPSARIVEGRSMAGVTLGSSARIIGNGTRIASGVLASWGAVNGFCYEQLCIWGRRPRQVLVAIGRDRVVAMASARHGWRTRRGVAAGDSAARVRVRYAGRIGPLITTCEIGGFGAQRSGYALNTSTASGTRHSFFEVARGRVTMIWIGAGRIDGGGC